MPGPSSTALRISVVIPSFNSGPYLREALESALSQQPPPWETIVQDGGSTDESLDILRELGELDSAGAPNPITANPTR